jgi:hypothetical protein
VGEHGESGYSSPVEGTDIEWHLDSSHPDQRVLRGKEEIAEYFRGWSSSFDEVPTEAERYVDWADYVVVPFVGARTPTGFKRRGATG